MTENKSFAFDYCYFVDSKQESVYKDLGEPIVNQALDGYNGTLFAYGQTGSGKTFSMMGVSDDIELKGVIPRLNDDLFSKIDGKLMKLGANSNTQFLVTVSYCSLCALYLCILTVVPLL